MKEGCQTCKFNRERNIRQDTCLRGYRAVFGFGCKEYMDKMTPEEIMLEKMKKACPKYENDFLIDDFGSLVFGLEEDDFYIEYLVEDDTWQVTMQSSVGDQPEAYYAVSSFEEALEIYFGHKIS